ncbi:hypothetical protein [Nocardioides euryhalodurans]|uniref:Peptidase S55 domain-containing protein n=1 Tax=Nocardioides euryhalodurans TaxID=2518370 RepID=A0A4P7GHR8_9ACTN|nr:hypothetical protein [Nocardioides euryhalodurans]QBR91227.1 hypothetical protein EXE57_02280 [Nocardioides euryhalodurans]
MKTKSARSRGAAAIVASMALLGSGAAITASPAQSVPPAEDCATAFPVADITDGMLVDGLTVTDGVDPEAFTGEVLGVLTDGIAPGVDMIIADMESSEIDRVGIWQGMSGSPVYTEDGQLLGAVAYGLSWGPSSVAGITPYEQMDDYLPGQPATAKVAIGAPMAREIAASTDVTARQASNGLTRLRVPMTISGIDSARLKQLRQDRKWITRQGRAGSLVGSAAGSMAAEPADVKDGGNLGAAISYGTITAGGVGTVTDRCADDVVGFGHPMMFSGGTSLGLMPADALYIQEDSLGAGFKVANLGEPAGTITQDRLTGITGAIGATPAEVDVSSTVSYGSRERDALSHSLSQDWNADVTAMQLLSLHDVTIDAIQPGSEVAGITLTGTADGQAFTIDWSDRFTSDYDIAYESLWSMADLVWMLSRMEGVQLATIDTTGEVDDSTDTLRVAQVQQKRRGHWVTVNRRTPAIGSPGDLMTLRTRLAGPDGDTWLPQTVRVPRKAGGEGYLEVEGGSYTWNEGLYEAETVTEVQEALASDVRNDEVRASVTFWQRRGQVRAESVSDPQALVVVGQRRAPLIVRR